MKIFIIIAILVSLVLLFILSIFQHKFKSRFWCKILDWHLIPRQITNDAGLCPRCKQKIKRNNDNIWETFDEST